MNSSLLEKVDRGRSVPEWIQIGRRKRDYGLMVDFHKYRAIVRANTAFVEGQALEEIAPGSSQYHPAMILIHRDWDNLYFVNEREGWADDDYFRLAEKRFKELGVQLP